MDKENNLPETDETNNVIEGTIVVAERSAEHDRLQAALLDQLELIGKNMVDGRYPPELELSPDSTHKELQWFTDLFDDIEVKVYSGDDYSNYLTHWESALPGERPLTAWPSEIRVRANGQSCSSSISTGRNGQNRPPANSAGTIRLQ